MGRLIFNTEVDDVPLALLAFQGRLVAGVGKALRIYDIGKKKLLRKVENKVRLFRFKCSINLFSFPIRLLLLPLSLLQPRVLASLWEICKNPFSLQYTKPQKTGS